MSSPAEPLPGEPAPAEWHARRAAPLLVWLALLVLLGLSAAGVPRAIEALTTEHLQQDAEHSAVALVRHMQRHVPDLEFVFDGEGPPPSNAQDALAALRDSAGLLDFMLFDAQGRLTLSSESTGTRPPALAAADPRAQAARTVARGGRVPTVLVQAERPGRHAPGDSGTETGTGPGLVSISHLPVVQAGALLGVVRLTLDQQERALVTTHSFGRAALLTGMALCLLMAAGMLLWRWRLRHVRAAERHARYLAQHDALTGVLNRSTFRRELGQACARPNGHTGMLRGGAGCALLLLDIDFFKAVNEQRGLALGDRLLREIARRLQAAVPPPHLLARLGGDQFVVLQRSAAGSGDTAALAGTLAAALAAPFEIGDTTLRIGASFGLVLQGTDGDEPDTLLQRAELALHRAKSQCRGAWRFYDAALDGELQRRRELVQDLREAVENDRLHLHFQPLHAAADGSLQGYEALARWPHPQRGFVPPLEFIALAEAHGLIERLGRWVLHSACREAAIWPAGLTVSVNVSPAQFDRDGVLLADVRSALEASGLAPQRLELEITESMLMAEPEQGQRTLQALHRSGVRIALDDFGAGFSNLGLLGRLPLDRLKIDRSLTQGLGGSDLKADLIVRSIVSMARDLGLRVTAEGVETEQQRLALCRHRCDTLQGYLLGRPQPAVQLAHRTAPTGAPAAAATAAPTSTATTVTTATTASTAVTPAAPAASAAAVQAAGNATAA